MKKQTLIVYPYSGWGMRTLMCTMGAEHSYSDNKTSSVVVATKAELEAMTDREKSEYLNIIYLHGEPIVKRRK